MLVGYVSAVLSVALQQPLPAHRVMLRNIAYEADARTLKNILQERFGRVSELWLAPSQQRSGHRGFGAAEFPDWEAAISCVEASGFDVFNRPLIAEHSTRPPRTHAEPAPPSRSALIRRLRNGSRFGVHAALEALGNLETP